MLTLPTIFCWQHLCDSYLLGDESTHSLRSFRGLVCLVFSPLGILPLSALSSQVASFLSICHLSPYLLKRQVSSPSAIFHLIFSSGKFPLHLPSFTLSSSAAGFFFSNGYYLHRRAERAQRVSPTELSCPRPPTPSDPLLPNNFPTPTFPLPLDPHLPTIFLVHSSKAPP